MKSKTVWNDEYRGISYEIQKFDAYNGKDAWTFYLYIPLDAIPEDRRERFWLAPKKVENSKMIIYNYYDEPLINNIEWHCGCTWYSKHGMDGSPRIIKIGCDYQHLWDDGHRYTAEGIEMEVKQAIDSFLAMMPDMLRRCQWDGRYVPESEGSLHDDIWYSNEGFKLMEESCKQWREKQGSTKASSSPAK